MGMLISGEITAVLPSFTVTLTASRQQATQYVQLRSKTSELNPRLYGSMRLERLDEYDEYG